MNFMEAIKSMQNEKICFRGKYPDTLFRIETDCLYSKEKNNQWFLEKTLGLPDYIATDWMISSKTYVKDATVGDIILDDEENILMIALENSEDDYIMAIDENGCLKTIDLDCNCYEKIGTYALIGYIIDQFSKGRKEMEE